MNRSKTTQNPSLLLSSNSQIWNDFKVSFSTKFVPSQNKFTDGLSSASSLLNITTDPPVNQLVTNFSATVTSATESSLDRTTAVLAFNSSSTIKNLYKPSFLATTVGTEKIEQKHGIKLPECAPLRIGEYCNTQAGPLKR